ncbi:hypothetical protein GGI07_005647 [Coemansia sp. Benny D115]|nr:hypothetical protein GGI07_005647 [Coemansia sp. Benny D115]
MSSSRKVSFRPTDTWYEDADKYWKSISSDVDGMLGGLEEVHGPDIRDSLLFLQKLRKDPSNSTGSGYACDCGAGIGRVTKHFLSTQFDKVDLVEQNAGFLQTATDTYLKSECEAGKVGDAMAVGLQSFTPAKHRYDVIWCQWVLSHLTDEDLVSFLRRAAGGLAAGGLICVKENVVAQGYVVDTDDSSVTRSKAIFESIFKAAGLTVVGRQTQTGFPHGLFAVNMWALRPN